MTWNKQKQFSSFEQMLPFTVMRRVTKFFSPVSLGNRAFRFMQRYYDVHTTFGYLSSVIHIWKWFLPCEHKSILVLNDWTSDEPMSSKTTRGS